MPRMRAFAAVFLIMAAAVSFAQDKKEMTVTVKETQIRATPSYLGKVLAKLAYGAKVTVLEEKEGWIKTALPSGKGQGWVHQSALKEYKASALKSGSSTTASGASSSEISAAGKGFTKEVEAQYQKNTNLDYAPVDKMEKTTVTPEQAAAFLKAGGLDTSMGGGE